MKHTKCEPVVALALSVTVSPENCKSTYASVPGNTCVTKTYTVNVTRTAASTNANLADLKVNNVTVPQFSADRFEYDLDDVANNVTAVVIANGMIPPDKPEIIYDMIVNVKQDVI